MISASEAVMIMDNYLKNRSKEAIKNIEELILSRVQIGHSWCDTSEHWEINQKDLEIFVETLRSSGYDVKFGGVCMTIAWCKEGRSRSKVDVERLNK